MKFYLLYQSASQTWNIIIPLQCEFYPVQGCGGSRASARIHPGWNISPNHHWANTNIHTFKLQICQESDFSEVGANPEEKKSTRDLNNLSSGLNQGAVRQQSHPSCPKLEHIFQNTLLTGY